MTARRSPRAPARAGAGLALLAGIVLLLLLSAPGTVLAAAKTIRITIDLPATWAVASEGFGGQEGSTDQAGVSTFPLTLAQPGTVLYGNGGTAANTTYQTMGFAY